MPSLFNTNNKIDLMELESLDTKTAISRLDSDKRYLNTNQIITYRTNQNLASSVVMPSGSSENYNYSLLIKNMNIHQILGTSVSLEYTSTENPGASSPLTDFNYSFQQTGNNFVLNVYFKKNYTQKDGYATITIHWNNIFFTEVYKHV